MVDQLANKLGEVVAADNKARGEIVEQSTAMQSQLQSNVQQSLQWIDKVKGDLENLQASLSNDAMGASQGLGAIAQTAETTRVASTASPALEALQAHAGARQQHAAQGHAMQQQAQQQAAEPVPMQPRPALPPRPQTASCTMHRTVMRHVHAPFPQPGPMLSPAYSPANSPGHTPAQSRIAASSSMHLYEAAGSAGGMQSQLHMPQGPPPPLMHAPSGSLPTTPLRGTPGVAPPIPGGYADRYKELVNRLATPHHEARLGLHSPPLTPEQPGSPMGGASPQRMEMPMHQPQMSHPQMSQEPMLPPRSPRSMSPTSSKLRSELRNDLGLDNRIGRALF